MHVFNYLKKGLHNITAATNVPVPVIIPRITDSNARRM